QVLRGRLIDLQGQPAAGVKLRVARLGGRRAPEGWILYSGGDKDRSLTWSPHGGMYARVWIAGTPKPPEPKEPPPNPAPTGVFREPSGPLPGWPAAVTTDAQGRFVLRGVGKGQGVGLRVSDDRFALQVLDFPPPDRDEEVTRVLAAARVLEGTVTDADTGKPVPQATVRLV